MRSRAAGRRSFGRGGRHTGGAEPGAGGARNRESGGGARRARDARERRAASAFDDRRAVVGFLLRLLAGWAIAMALLSLMPGVEQWAVASTVGGVRAALALASLHPQVNGSTIVLGHAALRIIPECTPLMPILMFGIAVAAYPAAPAWKLIGASAGVVLLWAYNVVRMLALIATLTWWPRWFKFLHVYLWQTVTLLVVCAMFLLWLRMAPARESRA